MTQTPELHTEHGTYPNATAAPVSSSSRDVRRSRAVHQILVDRHRCFLALIGAGVVAVLLAALPLTILQDSWLALVAGREITQHGIPAHVVLTLFGHGHAWTDQQWLAQLCMYGLHQVGGLGLVGVVNVALIASGLAGASAASIRLGASARSVLPVFMLVAVIAAFVNEVRTQPYAYPLFVLTVYLLAADSRHPTRAVYWCLPVLVLWGNIHGSAALGAGLVVLRGVTMAWDRPRHAVRPLAGRALALIAGAPLALLVTPYGTDIVPYYRATIVSPAFRNFVTEWQPVTAYVPIAVLFFLLAGVTVWALGRHGARSTLWDRAATLVLAVGAIIAVRNVIWFALATLILLPVWIDAAVCARERPAPPRPRLNALLLAAAGVLVVILALRPLDAGTTALTPSYPNGALAAVRAALGSHPAARVFAEESYADWLLWELPALRGRVAYDAAFELLSHDQPEAIADFKSVTGLTWERAASGYRVLVLANGGDPSPVHALRVHGSARLLYDRHGVAVLER